MEIQVVPIDLRGGPLDGKSAPNGSGVFPAQLELMYLPDPPDPKIDPDAPVPFDYCIYARRERGLYDFVGVENRTMPNGQYLAMKSAEKVYARIRALSSDPRLIEGEDSPDPPPSDALLPLAEAREMKEKALHAARNKDLAVLSEEQAWAFVRGALDADLAWADMGSLLHINGMRQVVFDTFGIEVPPRLER